ncbi:hypothetical protein BH18ACT9_BH18ACT9_19980 [soil metagenome]
MVSPQGTQPIEPTQPTQSTQHPKLDPSRALYAAAGVADLAVALGRTVASEAQARFARRELEPKALQASLEARLAELQNDAKALPTRVEKVINDRVAELNRSYADLAERGQVFVAKVRGQEATQQTKAAADATTTHAMTTLTQAKDSVVETAETAKAATEGAASETASTAKESAEPAASSARATTDAAKSTVASAAEATRDAASKTGQ